MVECPHSLTLASTWYLEEIEGGLFRILAFGFLSEMAIKLGPM